MCFKYLEHKECAEKFIGKDRKLYAAFIDIWHSQLELLL